MHIVTTSYNNEIYLRDYFMSLNIQTDPNFKIIFVDHGSTDNTQELLKHWKLVFKDRLVVLTIGKNTGTPVLPYNTGFDYAIADGAEWIWRVDSDDYLEAKAVELVNKETKTTTYDAIAIESRRFGAEGGKQLNKSNLTVEQEIKENGLNAFACFKASAWKALGGYSSQFKFEDWDFWIRFLQKGYQYSILKTPVHNYRRHEKSLTVEWKNEIKDIIDSIHNHYNGKEKTTSVPL